MKLRVVNSFVCLCVLSGICFALLCEIPLTQGGVEAARNIWVVVLYRRLEPAGCELALFSFYLDFNTPEFIGVRDPACACASKGQGRPLLPLASTYFFHGRDYQEHDCYDL